MSLVLKNTDSCVVFHTNGGQTVYTPKQESEEHISYTTYCALLVATLFSDDPRVAPVMAMLEQIINQQKVN